ncbi:CRTAC1 family protein [Halosimplex amylolyticum]|uniref:CRTAC1 family protein n=1 Tax=Halosimplex amylolyticum TaxID=3396616 RepID=UPI003F56EBA4
MTGAREAVVVVLVLVVGYATYGALYLAAGGDDVVDTLSASGNAVSGQGTTQGEAGGPELEPSLAYSNVTGSSGFEYGYRGEVDQHNGMITNAGAYVTDYDNDGWSDVLAVGGAEPVLFKNTGGEFARSGALPELDRTVQTAVFVDYDADGWEDLILLTNGRPPLLLENDQGTFRKRPGEFERSMAVPSSATVADYNGDGCLDLYVAQYGNWSERLPLGNRNYSAPIHDDNGDPNYLYRGTCDGFERVDRAGVSTTRWSLATSFVDLDQDGRPDIHVANDFNHDIVYLNRGNGSFEEVLLPERTNRNGMSSEVVDLNGDGRLDVYTTNIYYPEWAAQKINAALKIKARGNNLLINRGDGRFVERAEAYGVAAGGFGWGTVVADLDNDGDRDIVHATRYLTFEGRDIALTDAEQNRLRVHPFYSAPALWENQNGSFRSHPSLRHGFDPANSRGVAQFDYDRDGDLDLLVTTTSSFRLYRNDADDGNAIEIAVETDRGTWAYGASVYVNGSSWTRWRRVQSSTDFRAQDTRVVHVGVGDATTVDVRVVWPDGTERRFEDVAVDRRLVVRRSGIVDAAPFESSTGAAN